MEQNLEKSLALVRRHIVSLESELIEWISKEDLNMIRNFAFEYAVQEAKIRKVPKKYFSMLCTVRRGYVLDEVSDALWREVKRRPNKNKCGFYSVTLPDLAYVRRLILEGYDNF